MKKMMPIILSATTLFIVACICGSTASTPPEKIGESTSESSSSGIEVFGIGDVIQTGTLTITLNSADFQGGLLIANFTIENNGTDETTISTLLQFSAKDGDGSDLNEEIFDCGTSSIGGSILPGDRSRGNVCYSNVTTDEARIYFSPGFTSQTVVWEVSK